MTTINATTKPSPARLIQGRPNGSTQESLDRPTPAGERKRKQRGQNKITKAEAKRLLEFEPDPGWHPTALMIWTSGIESGQAEFYESSDLSVLHLTCEGIDHWLRQEGRKSPEMLRVLMQSLNSLLFTEADRRKAQIELEKVSDEDAAVLASVAQIFD